MNNQKHFYFSVIKRIDDYLHFSIEYTYGSNSCSAQGMAWMLENKPFYYLSDVYLNNSYAYPKKLNLAAVKETNSRIVFFDPEMAEILNGHILGSFNSLSKR